MDSMLVVKLSLLILILDIRSIYTQQQSFRDVDDFCLHCICKASTGCERKNCADVGGITFCGPYQISRAYWIDAGQPKVNPDSPTPFEECATDASCSEDAVRKYLVKYARNCNKDSLLDCEDIARLHKAGPFACDKPDLEQTLYWSRFIQCWYEERK